MAQDEYTCPPCTFEDHTSTTPQQRKSPPQQQQQAPPLCRFFVSHCCRFGDNCAFSHTLPEGGIAEARSRVACPYYPNCKYGDRCHLRHDDDTTVARAATAGPLGTRKSDGDDRYKSDSRSAPTADETTMTTTTTTATKPPPTASTATASATPTTTAAAASSLPSHECGICFEDPRQHNKRFGLLSGCSHCFCLSCVRQWRQSKSSEYDVTHSCPQCRSKYSLIVPSNEFYPQGAEKEAAIETYLEERSRKKCNKFNGRIGSCPFGRQCYYAHLSPEGEDLKPVDVRRPRGGRRRTRTTRRTTIMDSDEEDDESDDFLRDLDAIHSFLFLLNVYGVDFEDDDTDEDDDDDQYGWEVVI